MFGSLSTRYTDNTEGSSVAMNVSEPIVAHLSEGEARGVCELFLLCIFTGLTRAFKEDQISPSYMTSHVKWPLN